MATSLAGVSGGGTLFGPADDAGAGDAVHVRHLGGLQRGLAAERVLRLVGAAVGDDDGVFHGENSIAPAQLALPAEFIRPFCLHPQGVLHVLRKSDLRSLPCGDLEMIPLAILALVRSGLGREHGIGTRGDRRYLHRCCCWRGIPLTTGVAKGHTILGIVFALITVPIAGTFGCIGGLPLACIFSVLISIIPVPKKPLLSQSEIEAENARAKGYRATTTAI